MITSPSQGTTGDVSRVVTAVRSGGRSLIADQEKARWFGRAPTSPVHKITVCRGAAGQRWVRKPPNTNRRNASAIGAGEPGSG
ncbi:hypothetical protein GCM10012275_58660 [Longimycelium tulufanense]|uniref:Uncharacterized protein n=1 Tax=Longimycelium tulufanense TaxID=907463 RepID=A0A8J3CID1_9PSEU|nr:hypothetical protein GCM10012275_58660 [Longimycelium tulufanense]